MIRLFFVASLLWLPAVANPQRQLVSLPAQITLREAFVEIEKQTNLSVDYNSNAVSAVNAGWRLRRSYSGARLSEVLDEILAEVNCGYVISERHILVSRIETQQARLRRVTGVVRDQAGEPVIGANVVEKGTSNGVVTDIEGRFELRVSGGTLAVSYIGYDTREVKIGLQAEYLITLSENMLGLDEVVVIGYGTAKKSDLTGAVARADMRALENSPNVNIFQGLKGVVPGLNVGSTTSAGESPSISIRGQNSISGTTAPLIVLDGIIYRGSITDINPSDIESVDVLKDASSAAIYGSQAANGVLMITTKMAKNMQKPAIEYSGSFSSQGLMNRGMRRLDRDGYLNQLADINIAASRTGDDMTQRNPDFDVSKLFRDENVIRGYAAGSNVDWWDLLSEPAPYIQSHNLSLRGKSELSSYFFSFGFVDQKNIVKNDTYKRYNVRINLDAKVTEWFKVGTQSFFTISDFSGAAPGLSTLVTIPALVEPRDESGTLRELVYMGGVNPLLSMENPNKDVRNILTGTFYADVSIPWVKGLSYRLNYSNTFTTYKYFIFEPYGNGLLGQAEKSNTGQNEWTLDNIVTYKNDFGKHSINATFVYGVEKRSYENTASSAKNFTNKTLGYNYMQAAQTDLNSISSSAWDEAGLYTMARLGYTWSDRYIFTGTIRRDGFSGFGANNKFGYFPSAAVAWRLSEENFVKNRYDFVDNLKLRFSYGTSGNRTAGRYSTLAHMSTNMPFSSGPGGYVFGDGATGQLTQAVSAMANADLKWETTTALNLGIDFSLFNSRLYGNYEFYVSNTSNLLYNITIPSVNGMFSNTIPTNIGKLKNAGHEISITGVAVKTKDFQWNITGNFSTNRNQVVSILGLDTDNDGKEDDLISSNIFIGEPLGVAYSYNITGMWQVDDFRQGIIPTGFTYGTYKIEDLNNDGKYTAEDDRKILGYHAPLYRFSISNEFRYKDFELKIFVNSIQGGKNHYLGRPAENLPIPDHMTNNSYFTFDYWTPENPNARYRQIGYYTEALGADFSPYVSRSFIRLSELSVAYNLPAPILKAMKINRLKAYLSATNLFTITDWDGWDPEVERYNSSGTRYLQGLSYDGGYPTLRNYTIGLSFEF